VIEEGDPDRDLAALRVPQTGRLVATGNRYEPYQVVDPDGVVMDGAAQLFRDLLAAGKAESTVRSYGTDLLRWFRFCWAVRVDWDRATRTEARDFSLAGQIGAGGSWTWRSISTSFWRADVPETIVTCDGGTPAHRATARTTAALARPSAGGSRTHNSSVEPSHSRRAVRARAWTRTVSRVRPLTVCPPRAAGCETSSTIAPA